MTAPDIIRQIDAFVYQLYGTCPSSSGVSADEIKIVEDIKNSYGPIKSNDGPS